MWVEIDDTLINTDLVARFLVYNHGSEEESCYVIEIDYVGGLSQVIPLQSKEESEQIYKKLKGVLVKDDSYFTFLNSDEPTPTEKRVKIFEQKLRRLIEKYEIKTGKKIPV